MSQASFLALEPRQHGLSEPLSRDIELLDRQLADVLREQGAEEVIRLAQRLARESAGPALEGGTREALADPERAQGLLRAFIMLFQLLNTAEQKEIIRVNRERSARAPEVPRSESIREAVLRL